MSSHGIATRTSVGWVTTYVIDYISNFSTVVDIMIDLLQCHQCTASMALTIAFLVFYLD